MTLYLGDQVVAGVSNPIEPTRNIGQIIQSTLPLTDAGLHLLDGSLIDGAGIYSDFVSYMADLYNSQSTVDADFLQPTLSANGTVGGSEFAVVANAEAQYSTNPYHTYEAFDNNSSTYWRSGTTTGWVEFYNPQPLKVSKLEWVCAFGYPTGGNVQGSNDGTDWTTLTTWSNNNPTSFEISLNSNTNYYKYYRINVDGVNTDVIHCTQINITAVYQARPCFCTENEWQSSVTTYGVCGKFVYDSTNNTVRLPKIAGFVEGASSASSLGDLVEAGLPNIVFSTTYNFGQIVHTLTGGPSSIVTGYPYAYHDLDASNSNPIYGNSTTVQPQSVKVLYYIVLATVTKTEVEVDLDEIATDLNGKVSKSDCSQIYPVVETYSNGTSWYRVYSDGWCEQGGDTGTIGVGGATSTTTFLKPFIDTNYTLVFGTFGAGFGGAECNFRCTAFTNTSCTFYNNSGTATNYKWRACGYIS